MAQQHYSLIAGDWINLENIINDLTSRIITQTLSPTSKPVFGGLTLTDFSGVLKATAGVLADGATFDDILDGTSTTMRVNLNADLLDGQHAAAFEPSVTKYDLAGTANQIALSASGVGVLFGRNITLSLPNDINFTGPSSITSSSSFVFTALTNSLNFECLGGAIIFDANDASYGIIQLSSGTDINVYYGGNLVLNSLTGLLKATSGVVSTAVAGTDYQYGLLTATRIPYATGSPATFTNSGDLFFTPSGSILNTRNTRQASNLDTILHPLHSGKKERFTSNSDGIGQGALPHITWSTPIFNNHAHTYGTSAFIGGVFDGRNLWMIPYYSDNLVKVDTVTGSFTNYAHGYADDAFAGGAFDGKYIWLAPLSSNNVVRVDPADGTMTAYPHAYGTAAFVGAVFDGRYIWLVPYCADYLVRVDPIDGTMTGYAHTYGDGAFAGGVYDGQNIWLIPRASTILVKVNPATGGFTDYTGFPGGGAFVSGVFDGTNIWLIPCNTTNLVKVNPRDGTTTSYACDYGTEAFAGGCFDGTSLWLIPHYSPSIVKVNPATGAMVAYACDYGDKAFYGGIFDGQRIWMIPWDATSVVDFKPLELGLEGFNCRGPVNADSLKVNLTGGLLYTDANRNVLSTYTPSIEALTISDFILVTSGDHQWPIEITGDPFAVIALDRATNTAVTGGNACLVCQTADVSQWLMGTRAVGDNDWRIYNYNTSHDVLKLRFADDLATFYANILTAGTITGEQLTSTDDITMAGTLTNILAAADTLGIISDGETNSYTFSGTNSFVNNFTRKYVGSGTSQPSASSAVLRIGQTWDYDFTGSMALTGYVRSLALTNVFSGSIAPTSGVIASGSYRFFGVDAQCNIFEGTIDSTTKRVYLVQFTGGKFSSSAGGATTNIIQATNACAIDFIGGDFSTSSNTPTITGNPTLRFYGGKFTATGTTGGTSTSYGGYFSATGSDTNWGVYSEEGNNCLVENTRIGGTTAPTVPLDVTGAILGSTTIEATTGFKCGGTAAVADATYPVYNDGVTGGQVTSITTKGGIITGIAVIP